jgi:hypothetical protein
MKAFYYSVISMKQIRMAARSKAGNDFAPSNTGFVSSNLTQDSYVWLRLFSLLCVGRGFSEELITVKLG